MALAVPAGRTATVAGMAAGLADHTVASAGMVAALAVRPGYTVPVADMAAVPADHTATVAGMAAAPAGHTVAEPFVHTAAYAALAGHTVAYADTVTELAVLPDYMVLELTALPDHSVPDFAQPSQLFLLHILLRSRPAINSVNIFYSILFIHVVIYLRCNYSTHPLHIEIPLQILSCI